MQLKPYLKIARPDHWIKNIFMLPGFVLGLWLGDMPLDGRIVQHMLIAAIATCLAASANYTINEWLDADFDRFHPTKRARPSVMGQVRAAGVYAQWLLLGFAAIALALTINRTFTALIALFLLMGILYNVRPFRTKDRMHLDVLSESVNNPIRFLLGWFSVNALHIPPASVLLAYWMGGAYLMAVKRYSEYRQIGDPEQAALYRRSFRYYSENSLLLAAFFYALTSAFFAGIFLIKYRIEYLLVMPLLAFIFVWYLHIGMSEDSAAQRPEALYKERTLMTLVALALALIVLLTLVDIPSLTVLLETRSRTILLDGQP